MQKEALKLKIKKIINKSRNELKIWLNNTIKGNNASLVGSASNIFSSCFKVEPKRNPPLASNPANDL